MGFVTNWIKCRPLVFGMIHLKALPGSPMCRHSVPEIVEAACKQAEVYRTHHLDGVLLENTHDLPYLHSEDVDHITVSCMTEVCSHVKKLCSDMICGVQVLSGANRQALAIAVAAGLDMVRVESFVYSHVADEGLMNACAGKLMRYRKSIGGESIKVLADINKKHCSHAITSDLTIGDWAKAAQFFQADGIVVTGRATGSPADVEHLKSAKKGSTVPVFIGSGCTIDNIHQYMQADGVIVGSDFKENGIWNQPLVADRVAVFMERVAHLSESLEARDPKAADLFDVSSKEHEAIRKSGG